MSTSLPAADVRDPKLTHALHRLPLFPLQNIVLFPHALLPLHIFESRYRKMASDVLAGHHMLAISMMLEEEIPGGQPPRVARVAGVGEIVLAQEMPDGRYNLVVRGRARISIDQELPTDEPYRLIEAHEVPDEPSLDADELTDADASLRALVAGLADSIPEGGELLKQVVAAQESPAALADVLSAALVVDAPLRQHLLETTSVYQRLERLSAEVVSMTARIGRQERAN